MPEGDALAIIGIGITVILGIGGYFISKSVRKKSMSQKVRGGDGFQAGRDININD